MLPPPGSTAHPSSRLLLGLDAEDVGSGHHVPSIHVLLHAVGKASLSLVSHLSLSTNQRTTHALSARQAASRLWHTLIKAVFVDFLSSQHKSHSVPGGPQTSIKVRAFSMFCCCWMFCMRIWRCVSECAPCVVLGVVDLLLLLLRLVAAEAEHVGDVIHL